MQTAIRFIMKTTTPNRSQGVFLFISLSKQSISVIVKQTLMSLSAPLNLSTLMPSTYFTWLVNT